jgi:hypothetical protein
MHDIKDVEWDEPLHDIKAASRYCIIININGNEILLFYKSVRSCFLLVQCTKVQMKLERPYKSRYNGTVVTARAGAIENSTTTGRERHKSCRLVGSTERSSVNHLE